MYDIRIVFDGVDITDSQQKNRKILNEQMLEIAYKKIYDLINELDDNNVIITIKPYNIKEDNDKRIIIEVSESCPNYLKEKILVRLNRRN